MDSNAEHDVVDRTAMAALQTHGQWKQMAEDLQRDEKQFESKIKRTQDDNEDSSSVSSGDGYDLCISIGGSHSDEPTVSNIQTMISLTSLRMTTSPMLIVSRGALLEVAG